MDVVLLQQPKDHKAEIFAEIRKNYPLALLCILPGVDPRISKLKSNARKLGIEAESFERYQRLLLESGVWKIKGKLMVADFELLDLGDLTIADHMSMTINIISRLSGDRPYEYESLSLATDRELIKSFIGKIRKALKELYQDSQRNPDNDCIFSWSQTGMVNIQIETKKDDHDV